MDAPCLTMPTNILLGVHSLHEEISIVICEGRIPIVAARIADLSQPESYSLLSRQNIPSGKPVDEIALAPSISRALILCGPCSSQHRYLAYHVSLILVRHPDHQVYFYTLPALDAIPSSVTKPIRNVYTLSIDHEHMLRPAPPDGQQGEPIDFCVSKRSSIALYSLRDRLFYHKVHPCPRINYRFPAHY